MAAEDQLKLLRHDVSVWNAWREQEPEIRPDLAGAVLGTAGPSASDVWQTFSPKAANLSGANLSGANLTGADLRYAVLFGANLCAADLSRADLSNAHLDDADIREADLTGANLSGANLKDADFDESDLTGANLSHARSYGASFDSAKLVGAVLSGASLIGADLPRADLSGANLVGADLSWATLPGANLSGADLSGADLSHAILVQTNVENANLTGCRIYGSSVWDLRLNEGTKQQNLIITALLEKPEITVDHLEIAQFIYLLLRNEKIRDVIDTVGKKGVLLLGRFTGGRIALLETLRDELRKRDFLPIVFNFDKPETKDFTETVRLLAGLSRFVIVDITNPRSTPLELQATVPEYMIPFVPILERGEEPFAMFRDLWIKHREWVLDPIRYPSVDRLVEVLDSEIIAPAQARFAELLARKSEQVRIKDV